MYTIKYRPNSIEDFIGNKAQVASLAAWLLEWSADNKKTKAALISGLNGVGKNLIAELTLDKYNYNIIQLASDEERDTEYINGRIKPLLNSTKGFNGQKNAIIISDIDSGGDYGFISNLVDCIKETQIPMICICDDRYSQNIKPVINYCVDIKLSKPNYDEVYRLIYKVVTCENIKIGKSGVDKLYAQSNGDIRFILNALQLGVKKSDTCKDIQSSNIFDTTSKLFSMDLSLEEKFNYYWMANDIHILMIHENYINNTFGVKDEVKRLENVANSAESLSDADIMDSMFDFDLEPHVALNTIKATSNCNKKAIIQFPKFLGKISTMNKNKREKLNYETVKFIADKSKPTTKAKSKKTNN